MRAALAVLTGSGYAVLSACLLVDIHRFTGL